MFKTIAIALLALAVTACSAPETAESALKKEGFTDIQITGYSPFSCSKDDTFSTGFRARNVQGQVVEGTVCSGLVFKNATIRW